MKEVSTIGLDLAKNVFQGHGVDAQGKVLVRRQLRRAEVLPFLAKLAPCLVGMEACGTAHHRGRELIKLGHTVRLMPPAYVKAYVKRGKTEPSRSAPPDFLARIDFACRSIQPSPFMAAALHVAFQIERQVVP